MACDAGLKFHAAAGAVAAGGLDVVEVLFAFDSATPLALTTAAVGDLLIDTEIEILTAYNDAAAAMTVGTPADVDKIMSSTQVCPDRVGNWGNQANEKFTTAETINLYQSPGTATTGTGRAVLLIKRA